MFQVQEKKYFLNMQLLSQIVQKVENIFCLQHFSGSVQFICSKPDQPHQIVSMDNCPFPLASVPVSRHEGKGKYMHDHCMPTSFIAQIGPDSLLPSEPDP